MLVVFGTDHAGFELKEILKEYVSGLGFDIEDKGAFSYIENDDYPDFVAPVAREVSKDPYFVRGVVLGGSGQGEAMVANRSPNVRAAVFIKPASIEGGEGADDVIRLSREHNDSNVLSLGAKFLTEEEAKGAVKKWLETPFSGEERHKRRIRKIDESLN
ncbi:MAG: RpiB/LacA/LacB family sugar-phosphate isomerase [Candidatus Paceibacterota bacterium]